MLAAIHLGRGARGHTPPHVGRAEAARGPGPERPGVRPLTEAFARPALRAPPASSLGEQETRKGGRQGRRATAGGGTHGAGRGEDTQRRRPSGRRDDPHDTRSEWGARTPPSGPGPSATPPPARSAPSRGKTGPGPPGAGRGRKLGPQGRPQPKCVRRRTPVNLRPLRTPHRPGTGSAGKVSSKV